MPAAMKRAGIAITLVLGTSVLRADLNPDAWQSIALPTSGANNNEWYFVPDAENNPRVLVKATGSSVNVNRKLITGGPPAWTAGAAAVTANLNKQGIFLPKSGGGGYLIGLHNTTLRMIEFDSSGNASGTEIIENTVPVSEASISAALDGSGNLHVAYVGNPGLAAETLRYGCRSLSGDWTGAAQDLSESVAPLIRQTAVVPSAHEVANIYFTLDGGSATSLWRVSTLENALGLFLASPVNFENFVADTVAGSRTGGADRVYFFGSEGGSTWKFKRLSGVTITDLQSAGAANPRNIALATAPDGKQRIAWYDTAGKKVNYLKPSTVADGPPYTVGQPVVTTGGQTNADLCGLHFSPDGMPYLLYRRALDEGYIAFPNDNFDFNKNGRPDILDNAFNSTTAGLEALPVGPAAAGVANSANRLKFRFPTIGSATSNGLSAVTTTQENLRYGFELSPDGVTWTPVTTTGVINFTQTAATGTNPNQVRTMVGVVTATAPGTLSKRFARMVVTRPAYPY